MKGAIYDPDDLERLRAEFVAGAWAERSLECPGTDRLWASAAGDLDCSADGDILQHLSECRDCSAIWAMAREMLCEEADAESEAAVVSLDQRRPAKARFGGPALALAATALIAVAAGTGWVLTHRNQNAPVFRAQPAGDEITAAAGSLRVTREACRLRWTGAPEGSRWDLVITDSDLDVLADVKNLDNPEYLVPADILPEGPSEIFWRVTAHLPDHRTVNSETFTTEVVDEPSGSSGSGG